MASDGRDALHRKNMEAAIRMLLQQQHFEKAELGALRSVFPHVVDEFVTSAAFRCPPLPSLRRAAAKGLWPLLRVAALHPGAHQADCAAVIEAFVALPLPQLANLTLHDFGRTDPASEVAALAAGRWPRLRVLTIAMATRKAWMRVVAPGERWAAALAALTAAALPVEELDLREISKLSIGPVDFPLADIGRCFPATLTRLTYNYSMGPLGAAALAAAPLGPQLAHLEFIRQREGAVEAFAAAGTPWPHLATFSVTECTLQGPLDGLGAALPSATALWISSFDGYTEWSHAPSLLAALQATAARKVVLRWLPVGVLRGAADLHLPALRVLSVRYVKLWNEADRAAAIEGMNALLRAELPSLLKLSVSFHPMPTGIPMRPEGPVCPHWLRVTQQTALPEHPWPTLKSLSLEGMHVGGAALALLRCRVLHRVPRVAILEWEP